LQTLTKDEIHECEPDKRQDKLSLSQKDLSERSHSNRIFKEDLSERSLNNRIFKEKDMVISQSNSGETALSTDIEAPPPVDDVAGISLDDDEKDELLVDAFGDMNGIIFVPLAGVENDSKTTTRRFVPNGCAICLSGFDPGEKITWSYNSKCSHIFHHECVVHWYLTVGRKEQRKFRLLNPDLTPEEELAMICKFPMVCPCCRQSFCKPVDDDEEHALSLSPDSSGNVEAPASAGQEEQPEETPPIDASSNPQGTSPADATIDNTSPSPQATTPADGQEGDPEHPSSL
jgi:hypothetical protein